MFTPEMMYLRQLFRLGIPGTLLASVLFQELKNVIPCAALTLLWREPGASAARLLHESETEVNCGLTDAQSFSQMCFATGPELFDIVTPEHPVLRHIAQLLPGLDEVVEQNFQTLAVGFTDRGKPGGTILLHRPARQPFSSAEKATLVRLSLVLSSALNVDTKALQLITSESNAGILLLDGNMKFQYSCCRGRKLIQFVQAPANEPRHSGLADWLRPHLGVEDAARASNFVVRNCWGSFEFFLHRLADAQIHSGPLTAVAVHRQEPLALNVFRGCKTLALTEKQTEIALLLVKGLSYDAVATKLYIKATTVADHVRKIYEKVGVANRSELVTTLLLGAKKTAHALPFDLTGENSRVSAVPSYRAAVKTKTVVRGHAV